MEQIEIKVEEVRSSASGIKKLNVELKDILQKVSKEMHALNSTWSSPAQEALLIKFKQLLPMFDTYEQVINQYVTYLETTCDSYELLEKQMQNGVQG